MNLMQRLLKEEDGVGVVEVILILVVLIGLVVIFKDQLGTLVDNIFNKINSSSRSIYG
jgi:Flp pilus assembly pilin Flp